MATYYNTNNENGTQLLKSIQKGLTQEQIIMEIFKNPLIKDDNKNHKGFSASQIHKIFGDDNVPLTSIRRAISNLCYEENFLEKTDKFVIGIYGKQEHIYKIKQ
jgi:hypothetical protein